MTGALPVMQVPKLKGIIVNGDHASGAGPNSINGSSETDWLRIMRFYGGSMSPALLWIGSALLVVGLLRGFLQLLLSHPYLICLLGGALSMLVAALTHRDGLLGFLPNSVQELLLRRTIADFIIDDSVVQNLLRRWSRVFLICLGNHSPCDIRAIMADMEPGFVDQVFRQSLINWLPERFRVLLLPEAEPTYLNTALRTPQLRSTTPSSALQLTPHQISRLIREKREARDQAILEAPLADTVLSLVCARPWLFSFGASVLRHMKFSMITMSTLWASSAITLWLAPLRNAMLQGCLKCGVPEMCLRKADNAAQCGARWCAAFGLVSAGGLVLVMACNRRLELLRKEGVVVRRPSSQGGAPHVVPPPQASQSAAAAPRAAAAPCEEFTTPMHSGRN